MPQVRARTMRRGFALPDHERGARQARRHGEEAGRQMGIAVVRRVPPPGWRRAAQGWRARVLAACRNQSVADRGAALCGAWRRGKDARSGATSDRGADVKDWGQIIILILGTCGLANMVIAPWVHAYELHRLARRIEQLEIAVRESEPPDDDPDDGELIDEENNVVAFGKVA